MRCAFLCTTHEAIIPLSRGEIFQRLSNISNISTVINYQGGLNHLSWEERKRGSIKAGDLVGASLRMPGRWCRHGGVKSIALNYVAVTITVLKSERLPLEDGPKTTRSGLSASSIMYRRAGIPVLSSWIK